jgi:hypothetical protein
VIKFVLDQEFRALVVARGNPDIILLTRLVIVRESPVNQSQVSFLMIDHYVKGLYISVHNSMRMAIVQSLKEVIEIKSDLYIRKSLEKDFAFDVRYILIDQAGSLGPWISDHIEQANNIWPSEQCLQDLDLSVNLLSSYRLKNLHDALLVVPNVAPLINL